MKVMPIRCVRDMAASERFYRALGLEPDARQRDGGRLELPRARPTWPGPRLRVTAPGR